MKRRTRGFTLVEMLVTVAIVGVLASIAMPLMSMSAQRAKEQELRNSLRQIREAIDSYKHAAEDRRIAVKADQTGYPPDLKVLVDGVTDIRDPKGAKIYFLRRLPRDPFGDSAAAPEDTWGLRSYESPPNDPQPGKDVYDVRSLSPDKGLNGVPYAQW